MTIRWWKIHHRMVDLQGFVAAFLLIAACRSVVPGLCATQLAAKEAMARNAALPACCQVHTAEDDGTPSVHTPRPEHGPCAFCHLIRGMVDPLDPVHFPLPATAKAVPPLKSPSYITLDIPRTHRGRAPPVHLHT